MQNQDPVEMLVLEKGPDGAETRTGPGIGANDLGNAFAHLLRLVLRHCAQVGVADPRREYPDFPHRHKSPCGFAAAILCGRKREHKDADAL